MKNIKIKLKYGEEKSCAEYSVVEKHIKDGRSEQIEKYTISSVSLLKVEC